MENEVLEVTVMKLKLFIAISRVDSHSYSNSVPFGKSWMRLTDQ